MKTTRTLTLIGLFLSFFVIISCKKNDLANAGSNEPATGKVPVTNVIESVPPSTNLPDCNTHCIDPGGPFVESAGSKTQYWGNPADPQHWKTVSHVAYNTSTSFIVEVTFTHSGGNASNTVSVTAFGSTQSVATLASDATATFTFALPAGWNACDNVPFSIYQEGQNSPMNLSCSYNLYGVCANKGCETSFTGEAIACGNQREAVYTFTSKDALSNFKIQGGLTNFTGADAIVTVTGGSNITQSQWTVGGSSNRVIKVEGDINACETITIHITWNSTNSGGVITGSWSVSANGGEVAPAVAGLTCN
jgi:hypothetical protein